MSDHPPDDGYEMVYPFVVVTSKGGPYDDAAFVAGVRYGQIDAALASGVLRHNVYVEPGLVPQLDLLAMHHGYAVRTKPWEEHPDEWVHAAFDLIRWR